MDAFGAFPRFSRFLVPVAGPLCPAAEADMADLETWAASPLPADYRHLLCTFGAGTLGPETALWDPGEVRARTPGVRDPLAAPRRGTGGEETAALYFLYGDIRADIPPGAVARLLIVGATGDGDHLALLPDLPGAGPTGGTFLILARRAQSVVRAGRSVQGLLAALDPRRRHGAGGPCARVLRGAETTLPGAPMETPYAHPFRPAGDGPGDAARHRTAWEEQGEARAGLALAWPRVQAPGTGTGSGGTGPGEAARWLALFDPTATLWRGAVGGPGGGEEACQLALPRFGAAACATGDRLAFSLPLAREADFLCWLLRALAPLAAALPPGVRAALAACEEAGR